MGRRGSPANGEPITTRSVEPARRRRLDVLLVERGLAASRERAQALIMAGAVLVDGRPASRAAELLDAEAQVELRKGLPYVGRGGFKLAHALDRFGLSPAGRVAVDVGASTGGFTDVLLQRGARRVYAVDVGYGQIDLKLRQDPRVVVLDRTNIRYLEALPEPCDLATLDVSFISLRLAIPPTVRLLAGDWAMIALVKPQFEAGRERVGRGGIIRDPAVHRDVLISLGGWTIQQGLAWRGLTASPVRGAAGNVEFLAWVSPRTTDVPSLDSLVEQALAEAAQVSRGPAQA